ncbi:uncharacterized protein LOC133782000 isoform X2 [Humulus lupulus]|uniref:uncharacterized protein LOC133782000 isoform X2 n=1 Tax=Humulus lupulus TaxID=3486 RepID=UPI002B41406F|nr:uncharacterized protein LOC133782000 isoform X2 [Humulus lupulus]
MQNSPKKWSLIPNTFYYSFHFFSLILSYSSTIFFVSSISTCIQLYADQKLRQSPNSTPARCEVVEDNFQEKAVDSNDTTIPTHKQVKKAQGRVNIPFAWVCRGAQGRVDRFAEFREEDRRWQAILSEENLRGSSLWSQVPRHPEDLLMAGEMFRLNLTGFGAMERLRARKKQAIASSSAENDVVNEVPPLPLPTAGKTQKNKKKRTSPTDSSDWFAEKIELSFPSSASAHSEFRPHLEEVNKLLWPEDKDRFDQLGSKSSLSASISHVFQGMQGLMWANEKIQELEKQVKTLNRQNVDFRSEVKGLKTCKKDLEKLNGDLKTQLDAKELDASRLQPTLDTLANVRTKVDMLEGRLTDIALETEIQCRGQMAIDFRDGKTDSWNVSQFIADYEELQQMRVEEAIQANNLAVSFGDMTTGDLGQED